MEMRMIKAIGSALCALYIGTATAQSPPTENTGPNITIARTVTGKMTFRTLSDGRIRGGEDFRLLVHPDGTRQIFISKDFKAVNAQQTMIARVDARFRPLETYASYWTRDGFKGSIYVTVAGTDLRAVAQGPKGRVEDAREVPDHISVVHHGEIMNGWYLWSDDPKATGEQSTFVYNIIPVPRGDAQVAGMYHESKFTRLGPERVTTPAGTFDAMKYRMTGVENLDLWVAGEDRLLVRQTDEKNDREYILTEMNISGK
jgi:hypothetical protein